MNNAGIFPGGPTTSIAPETFDEVFAVNVKAPFFLVAALVPAMLERGAGTIINMGLWGARLGIGYRTRVWHLRAASRARAQGRSPARQTQQRSDTESTSGLSRLLGLSRTGSSNFTRRNQAASWALWAD